VGGEIDRVFSLDSLSRVEALDQAKAEATRKAIAAGADPAGVHIVDVEEVPLAYLPGNATRIRVKAVGDLLVSQSDSCNPKTSKTWPSARRYWAPAAAAIPTWAN
jgi:hypothetical protein